MFYLLYPPFFVVPEQSDFPKAWEAFCYKMICLAERDDRIVRLKAPDCGIDFLDPRKQVAYQCKSVESGLSSRFNVSKAIASARSARTWQHKLQWETYSLCTNVDVSGAAYERLLTAEPSIELRPASYWVNLCERFPEFVARNFRVLLQLPHNDCFTSVRQSPSELGDKLLAQNGEMQAELFLYADITDKVVKIHANINLAASEFAERVRMVFDLPQSRCIKADGAQATLEYEIVFKGKPIPHGSTLLQGGVKSGSVVTFSTRVRWSDGGTTLGLGIPGPFLGGAIMRCISAEFSSWLESRARLRSKAKEELLATVAAAFAESYRGLPIL